MISGTGNNSKCPSCSNTNFEAVKDVPKNLDSEIIFIRCTSCKSVVGVIDNNNADIFIKKIASKLAIDLDNTF